MDHPGSGFVPEGAEPTEQFHARCSETLLKLFEYMIRMDVTEAACVTHGGVIMSMLSQRALPSRHPEQWMADPGCGYTVQTDVQLWMRDRLVEAIDIVPFGYADTLRGQAEARRMKHSNKKERSAALRFCRRAAFCTLLVQNQQRKRKTCGRTLSNP